MNHQISAELLVIIPTYNEIDNIHTVINRLSVYNADVLFVDDNSPDGTGKEIEKISASNPKIKLLSRKGKLGLGSAYIEGFNFALDKGYERIVMMDCDLSHPPEKIKEMIDVDSDFVVGSRYVSGGNITGWPLYRHILSSTANLYAGFMLGRGLKEYTGGFNCIKRKVLQALDLKSLKSEGYAFVIELKYRCIKKGFIFKEIPITFKERENGVSKISKNIIFEAFLLVLKLRLGF